MQSTADRAAPVVVVKRHKKSPAQGALAHLGGKVWVRVIVPILFWKQQDIHKETKILHGIGTPMRIRAVDHGTYWHRH